MIYIYLYEDVYDDDYDDDDAPHLEEESWWQGSLQEAASVGNPSSKQGTEHGHLKIKMLVKTIAVTVVMILTMTLRRRRRQSTFSTRQTTGEVAGGPRPRSPQRLIIIVLGSSS